MSFFELSSEERTVRFGAVLAACLRGGDFVEFEGDLGAGKTTLIRAVARGLGLPEDVPVTSPTFALVQEYATDPRLVHADVYRLEDPDELRELGLVERLGTDALVVVEWGERFADVLGAPDVIVRLETVSETGRRARIEALTPRGRAILDALVF